MFCVRLFWVFWKLYWVCWWIYYYFWRAINVFALFVGVPSCCASPSRSHIFIIIITRTFCNTIAAFFSISIVFTASSKCSRKLRPGVCDYLLIFYFYSWVFRRAIFVYFWIYYPASTTIYPVVFNWVILKSDNVIFFLIFCYVDDSIFSTIP